MSKNIKKWCEILVTVFSIIIVRNLLEMILKRQGFWSLNTLDDWISWWFHFPLFYLTLWISGTFGIATLIRIPLIKSASIMTVFLLLVLVGPVIDFFGNVGSIPYLYVKDPYEARVILLNLLNPFKDLYSFGVPFGPRVEVFLTVVFLPIVILKFSSETRIKKIFQIITGILFSYFGISFLCCWPAILNAIISNSKSSLSLTDSIYGEIYLLIIISVFIIAFFKSSKRTRQNVYFFLRPYRLFHYLFLVLSGCWLSFDFNSFIASHNNINFFILILNFLAGITSFILIFIATTIANDFTDQKEDQINRINFFKENPEQKYSIILLCIILFIISFFLSFSVGSSLFSIILLWSALSFIYSFPPLRLKRFIFLSNIIIAVASSLAILYGAIISGNKSPIQILNETYFSLIFIVTFCGSFIKDIPDAHGDSTSGINTLPGLFPPERFKALYLILILICYLITFFFSIKTSNAAYLVFIPAFLSIYAILKTPNENKLLFISYFLAIVIVTGCFKCE